jgi:hypothetical protein
MKQSEFVKAIEMLVNHHSDISSEGYSLYQEWIKEIAAKNEEIKELQISRDEQIRNLIKQIEYEIGEANEPSLPFEKTEEKSCDFDCDNCSEPCDKLGEPEKGTSEDLNKQMIEQLITHYASSDPNINVDEIKSKLKWMGAKEIKKLIYELKNNSEKKLDAEIAQKVFLKNKRG